MAAIKIRVGASADANIGSAFTPIVAAAKKARAQVETEMGGAAKKTSSVYRTNAGEAARAADAAGKAAEKAAQQQVRAQERAMAHVARIKERYFREEQRRQEQASRQEEAAVRKRAEQTGYWSVRYAARGFQTAGRFGMDIARGAGVNLNMGAIIGKAVSMEKRAVDLANSALGTGVAGNEKRVGAGSLVSQAREIGISSGYDPEKVLEGLQKFVGKTGDLKTARDMMADLARLSSATGSELEDMVDAAGDVANAVGEVPNKGKVVESVMRAIAGQGKVGAVEMKDLAVQMAKLGSAAGAFQGDQAKNVETMGIFAQMARARGGAASATQAATSVAAMVNTFKTPARIAAFKNEGIDVIDKKTKMIRDPFEILKEALTATQGDPERFKKMYANVQGARAVEGFANIYRQAGGGQKGMDAVTKEFDRLKAASMSKAAIDEAHAARMQTSAAKIEVFNAKLTEVGARIAERILPQMEKLGPIVLDAVDGMGKLVAWIAENPLKSAFVLLGASIARAGAETVIRAGIESMIKNAAAGGMGGTAGKALSGLGSGLTIAAIAVTTFTVGSMIVDKMVDSSQEAEDRKRKEDAEADLARTIGRGAIKTGGVSGEDQTTFNKEIADLEARIAAAKDASGYDNATPFKQYAQAALNYVVGGPDLASIKKAGMDKESLPQLQAQLAELQGLKTIMAGVVKVHVVNQTGSGPTPGGTPTVDPATRTGP